MYKTLRLFKLRDLPYAFIGTYIGYNTDSPNHIFRIRLINYGIHPRDASGNYIDGYYYVRILGLPSTCGGNVDSPSPLIFSPEVECTYNHFSINFEHRGVGCVPVNGEGEVDNTHQQLILKYTISYQNGSYQEKTFVGKKQ